MSDSIAKREKLDYAAIGLSGLCVLHCTALPLLAAAAPWIAALGIVDDWFHLAMLLVVIPLSLYALGRSWRSSGRPALFVLGLFGLSIMLVATFEFMAWHSNAVEQWLTLVGAAILSLAHLGNLWHFIWPARMASAQLSKPGCQAQ